MIDDDIILLVQPSFFKFQSGLYSFKPLQLWSIEIKKDVLKERQHQKKHASQLHEINGVTRHVS